MKKIMITAFLVCLLPIVIAQTTPSEWSTLEEITTAYANSPDVMSNPDFVNALELRVQEDPNVINNNPALASDFLSRKYPGRSLVTDTATGRNVRILRYSTDGYIEVEGVNGQSGTRFNLNNVPDAKIHPNGCVESTLFGTSCGARIELQGDVLDIQGGHTKIPANQEVKIAVKDGSVQVGNKKYVSGESPVKVVSQGTSTHVSGKNVVETSSGGETTAMFSGTVKVHSKNHQTFAGGTEYTSYVEGQKSATYIVSQDTEFRTTENCDGSTSCIQNLDGAVRVVSAGNNKITINTLDDSIIALAVDKISDESIFVFNEQGKVELTFSKNPMTVKGDPAELKVKLDAKTLGLHGDLHALRSESDGLGTSYLMCSECEEICLAKQDFEEILKQKNPLLVPGTEVTAAYTTHANLQVFRTEDGFYIYDPEFGSLIHHEIGGITLEIKNGHRYSVKKLGPLTLKTMDEELAVHGQDTMPAGTTVYTTIPLGTPPPLHMGQRVEVNRIGPGTLTINGQKGTISDVPSKCGTACAWIDLPGGKTVQVEETGGGRFRVRKIVHRDE